MLARIDIIAQCLALRTTSNRPLSIQTVCTTYLLKSRGGHS